MCGDNFYYRTKRKQCPRNRYPDIFNAQFYKQFSTHTSDRFFINPFNQLCVKSDIIFSTWSCFRSCVCVCVGGGGGSRERWGVYTRTCH